MQIVLSGGGTAGHVYPALAVADELTSRGHSITFVGTPDSFEENLVPQKGYQFVSMQAAGFNRKHPLTLITSTAKIGRSVLKARSLFSRNRPDAVVGFGGYVSIPVGVAASMQKIPLVLHEQNSVPGMANRYLSKRANAVAATYDSSASYFPHVSTISVTGNPVREEVLASDSAVGRARLGIPKDATVLLVFGGSRGARHINTVVAGFAKRLLEQENLYVLHVTGKKEEQTVRDLLESEGISRDNERYQVFGYLEAMEDALAAADLVIARAGATSIAELTALGKPAILIPYPYATEDHQTKNAQSCVDSGAAISIPDDMIDNELEEATLRLLVDTSLRDTMRTAALKLGYRDAAARVADLILEQIS